MASEAQNIADILEVLKTIHLEMNEPGGKPECRCYEGHEPIAYDGLAHIELVFGHEEYENILRAADICQLDVEDWVAGVAEREAVAPLNVRVALDSPTLATLQEATEATGAPSLSEYIYAAALSVACLDLLKKDGLKPARTLDDLVNFCRSMALTRTMDTDSNRVYRDAMKDVIFWIEHPGIAMAYLDVERDR
jgi:hypothetical protein